MSSRPIKSKRNLNRKDKSTGSAKTSRRLPQPSQKEPSETLRRLAERMEKHSSRIKVVTNVPDEEKISIALSHLMKPYIKLAKDADAYDRLVALAIVAWNASILSPELRDKLLGEVEKNLPKDLLQESRDLITD